MGCFYAVGACLVFVVVGTVWGRIRTRRIAASRPGETFDTFCASFTAGDAPPEVLRAVYATFQAWCSDAVAPFPVRAADDIGRIYGMVDSDLDDAVREVLTACGRVLPSEEPLRRKRPIATVREFVGFVAARPKSVE